MWFGHNRYRDLFSLSEDLLVVVKFGFSISSGCWYRDRTLAFILLLN